MTKQENKVYEFFSIKLEVIEGFRIDLNYWINKCYNYKEKNPISVSRSNKGGYQTPSTLFKDDNFSILCGFLNKGIEKSIFKNQNLKIGMMWFNISNFGNYNIIHNHQNNLDFNNGGSIVSGILYLKIPENGGGLNFYNPLDINLNHYHEPKEGQLLLFDSFLPHSVDANLNQEDRISIAFNYIQ